MARDLPPRYRLAWLPLRKRRRPPTTLTLTTGCAYDPRSNSINGYPNGGSFTVAVTTTPATGCTWAA